MLEKSLGLLFFLKQPQNYKSGPMYIYLRITVDGAPKELSIKRLWQPSRWSPASGRATGNKEDSRALNNFLDTLNSKAHEARRILIDSNKQVTAQALKDLLTGIDAERKMILEIFQHHNDQVKELVGQEFASGTLERYCTSLDHTRSFMKWKYGIDDMDVRKLNYEFISEYAFWLKSIRRCNHNTTMKYLANFKKIVLIALKNGWIQKDPFIGFKLSKREVERPFLTDQELLTIENKQFPTDRLNYVKDIFIFSCFTGLAYADVKKLKRTEIANGVDGEQWIFTHRQKTETSSRIPLLPTALAILEKYNDHPLCQNKDMLLPILSNQKMNAYLKEIADVCGINKNLTFHIARHTFATTVTLSNGVPIETVSKMLGHKNLHTTQHYAKILDIKVSNDMQMLKKKYRSV